MAHRRIKKSASLFIGMLMSTSGMTADTATITVSGTLVDVPNCTVNNNSSITVDFGEIIISQIDGTNYKKAVPYTLKCTSLAKQGLSMTLKGTASQVGSSYFSTNKNKLGIKIMSGTSVISPNGSLKFNYGTTPALYAIPYSSATNLPVSGAFTGTATMVIAYQ